MHKKKKTLYIYPTRIKLTNLGDLLINTLLIRELSKEGIVVLDGTSESLERLSVHNNPHAANIKSCGGIRFFFGKPILRWFNLIGSLFQSPIVFDPPGGYSDNKDTIKGNLKFFKYLMRSVLLNMLNGKTIRLGISLEPLSKAGVYRQKTLSRFYSFLGLRDENNFLELKRLGFSNLQKVEDLAYLLDPTDFILRKPTQQSEQSVVLSFRGAIHGDKFEQDYVDLLFQSIIASIPDLKRRNIVLCFQVKEDFHVMKYMAERFQQNDFRVVFHAEQLDMEQALSVYADASLVLTNRLHVALIAMLCNTPSIVLTDVARHAKIVNLLMDLGIPEFIIDINSENKSEKFENLSRKLRETGNSCQDTIRNKKERLQSIIRSIV